MSYKPLAMSLMSDGKWHIKYNTNTICDEIINKHDDYLSWYLDTDNKIVLILKKSEKKEEKIKKKPKKRKKTIKKSKKSTKKSKRSKKTNLNKFMK